MNIANTPSLYKTHTDLLTSSAISTAAAQACGVISIPAPATAHPIPAGTDCIQLQYHTLDGTPLPSVRYATQDLEGVKEEMQVTAVVMGGRAIHPYVPLVLGELMKEASFLVITVGEIPALAGCSNGLACVAVHASDGWIDPDHIGVKPTSETPVHSMLLDMAKKAGRVLVLGNSNAANPKGPNPDDAINLKALTAAIQRQSDGVVAAYMTCPSPSKLKAYKRGTNVELSDWIAHESTQLTTPTRGIIGLMQWFLKKAEKVAANKTIGGYIALGVSGPNYYAWSNRRNMIDTIHKKDVFNGAVLATLASYEYCTSAYPKTNAKGEDTGIDFMAMGGQLLTDCEAPHLPPFKMEKVVHGGVYLADDNPEVVVVNGNDLFRSDGKPIERVGGKHIYARSYDLGITADTEQATTEEAKTVLDAVDTWNWHRKSDATLFLGELMTAYCSGAHKWRTHAFIHGVAVSGKSHLMRFAAALLGEAGRYTVASSPAAVRQALDGNALASICDEQGADSGPSELMLFFRNASSAGFLEKGDPKQGGVKRYQLATTGIVAGVNLPSMDSQQTGRFLLLSLGKVKASSKSNPHPMVGTGETYSFPEAQILGEKLFSRMVHAWPRFLRALKLIKAALPGDRFQDTFGLPLAGAWIALHDEELTDAAAWIASFDLEQDVERIRTVSDNDDFLDYLLSSKIAVERGQSLTVAEVCFRSQKEGLNTGPYTTSLRMAGMRVRRVGTTDATELLISPREQGFKAIFKDAKVYGDSDLAECIRRIPGASKKFSDDNDKKRFGAGPARYLSMPLDLHGD
jgi:hypothetical protein